VPKITDFGLAKRIDVGTGLTATGVVMGTPAYMAPEQASGKAKHAGPKADVYALGAIFYHCLTGRPPFAGKRPLDILIRVTSEEPIPHGGKDGVIRLWDVNRGQSAGDLKGHQGVVTALAFAPNGQALVSGGGDPGVDKSPGQLKVWDMARRIEVADLKGHQVTVASLAFDRDGMRLASGGLDGTLLLWDVSPTGKTLPEANKEHTRRLPAEQIEELVRDWLTLEARMVNVPKTIPLKDLTTDAMWRELGVQLVQLDSVKELVYRRDTFVVKQGKLYPLLKDKHGRLKVLSLCVADLRRDGRPLLVYTFSFGSGVHRSQVAVYDCLAREPIESIAAPSLVLDPAHDWTVKQVDAHTVQVEGGKVLFGNLELRDRDGKATLILRLPDDLPPAVRNRIKGAPAHDNQQPKTTEQTK
jgi:serine/threonine protein kinase